MENVHITKYNGDNNNGNVKVALVACTTTASTSLDILHACCRWDIVLILSLPLRTPILLKIPCLNSPFLMVVHTSRSVHHTRRYGTYQFLFTHFHSFFKYSHSPSVIQITGHTTYFWIGIYKMSMTVVRSWRLVGKLQRNPSITFHLWRRSYAPYSMRNIQAPSWCMVCSPLFLSLLEQFKCRLDAGEVD